MLTCLEPEHALVSRRIYQVPQPLATPTFCTNLPSNNQTWQLEVHSKSGQEKKEITYILWKHIFHCHPSRMPPPRHEALPPRPLGGAGRSARARTARSTASGGGGEPCAPTVRHQGVQMIAGASFTIKPQRDLLKIQDFHGFLGWQTVDNHVRFVVNMVKHKNMISRIASAWLMVN